ncbi:MAG: Gfo/Idh/MocA family oxidoreductase [Pseudomonadota bacterium]
MKQIRCGVIGVGYLGEFHAEKYATLPQAELIGVCDTNKKRADEVAQKFNTKAFYDQQELLNQVDAVSIVVPTSLHHAVAKACLEQDKHVLLEKPITTTVAQAEELIRIAKAKQLTLQIGHLERYNSVLLAVEKMIHEPRFIESHRLSIFNPRNTDVNVMLDLMIHDIDIIQYLVKAPITNIRANGTAILTPYTDIVNARIEFANQCVANVTASRVSFRRERRMRLFQSNAYITFDMHKKHVSYHCKGLKEMFPGIPEIISEEKDIEDNDALNFEISDFIKAILENKPPKVSGEDGKNALHTAILITESVKNQFTPATEEVNA